MNTNKYLVFLMLIILPYSISIKSEVMIIDSLDSQYEINNSNSWKFFTDGVMGGLSKGRVIKDTVEEVKCYRMTGNITTENNGGFIQIRLDFDTKDKINEYEGFYIKVYGNNKKYYLHIRTGLTLAPWQYYAHSFNANKQWNIIKTPFKDFKRSNFYQPKKLNNQKIKSVGLIAGFDNYQADICLAEIGLY